MANAKLIKELRDKTGAGFLDVKKAIDACGEDFNAATEWLNERGAAKAAKKSGAVAAEGVVKTVKKGNNVVLFEVNSQTDFVAKNDEFKKLIEKIGEALINNKFTNSEDANLIKIEGKTIGEICQDATSKIGEKIVLRRAQKFIGEVIGAYTHVNGRVASVLVCEGSDEEAARNVCMHIASMNPEFLDESSVPEEKIAEIKAEIAESPSLVGKPENIKQNILKGLMIKKLSQITLLDQEFVMDKIKVSQYLTNKGLKAIKMARFELGEGIEKVEVDFAAEVASQMSK